MKWFLHKSIVLMSVLISINCALGQSKVKICVSIPPQEFFLKKIGGQYVEVLSMLPPGANPTTYEPKPSSMISITKAKAYISIGVPFEKIWLKRFMGLNPHMKIFYAGRGIELYPMNGNNKNHGHGLSYDPHIWLSPPLLILQARNILDSLLEIDPEHQSSYIERYESFLKELSQLDSQILRILLSQRGKAFMVYHPSWGYFARSYGLKQIPVEIEGKEPSPKEMAKLLMICKEFQIKALYYQPQFPKTGIKTLAKEAGLKLIPADPLSKEWDKNLLNFARSLRENLK